MEDLRGYILALIVASLVAFLADSLLKEGGIRHAARFGIALVLVLLMLAPLQKLIGGLSVSVFSAQGEYSLEAAAQLEQGVAALVKLQNRFSEAEVQVSVSQKMQVEGIVIRRSQSPPLAEQAQDAAVKEQLTKILCSLYGLQAEAVQYADG